MLTGTFRELFAKNRQVFIGVWSVRHELEPVAHSSDELAFLPASLELKESSPHPAARITLWALLAIILIAIVWANFGKIETFNYTKYGLIHGLVSNDSLDTIPDEKLGLIDQARIKLKQNRMNIDVKSVQLAPGMAISVEVKTGQRRIIKYYLSPLSAHVSESVQER